MLLSCLTLPLPSLPMPSNLPYPTLPYRMALSLFFIFFYTHARVRRRRRCGAKCEVAIWRDSCDSSESSGSSEEKKAGLAMRDEPNEKERAIASWSWRSSEPTKGVGWYRQQDGGHGTLRRVCNNSSWLARSIFHFFFEWLKSCIVAKNLENFWI